jgi:hypothetical protein
LVVVLLAASGCGRKITAQPVTPAIPKASVPLPEWAPKNPSPEFLRAARVLKPFPLEELLGGAKADPSERARWERETRAWPSAWECFGTLSDEQVQRFLSSKPAGRSERMILIPFTSLTPKQRAAVNRYFEASRRAMTDRIVDFYKCGAKEDLSNVDAGFQLHSHSVTISFRVRRPDKDYSGFSSTIATM